MPGYQNYGNYLSISAYIMGLDLSFLNVPVKKSFHLTIFYSTKGLFYTRDISDILYHYKNGFHVYTTKFDIFGKKKKFIVAIIEGDEYDSLMGHLKSSGIIDSREYQTPHISLIENIEEHQCQKLLNSLNETYQKTSFPVFCKGFSVDHVKIVSA